MIFDWSDSYLDESGLVAEAVVAVLAHAVEVGLVLPVVAVGELAVLIEPEMLGFSLSRLLTVFWEAYKPGGCCIAVKEALSLERNDDDGRRLLTLIYYSAPLLVDQQLHIVNNQPPDWRGSKPGAGIPSIAQVDHPPSNACLGTAGDALQLIGADYMSCATK